MNITFLDYKVTEFQFIPSIDLFELLADIPNMDMPNLNHCIGYTAIFPENESKNFFILFDVSFMPKKLKGKFKLKFIAHFECSDEIDEEFKASHFPRVNAPAIAYPFLRSFINNYFINAGFNPVLLPTYNFSAKKQ